MYDHTAWTIKPVMMLLAGAATIDGLEGQPAITVTLVTAVVAVVYWLMRVLDRLIVKRGPGGDPHLAVLQEIRDALGPMREKITDVHRELNIPHPYNPGFRAFAQETRKDICTIRSNSEEILVALDKTTRAVHRLDEDLRVITPTVCPIKGEEGKRLLERLKVAREDREE